MATVTLLTDDELSDDAPSVHQSHPAVVGERGKSPARLSLPAGAAGGLNRPAKGDRERTKTEMSVKDVNRYFTNRLSQAGVEIAVGGIDYSLNIDREGNWPNHWARQAWIIVPKQNQSNWGAKLRDAIQPTDLIPQPIFVREFDGNSKGYAYALKTTFKRRESYTQTKRQRGGARTCRNTSTQPLRKGEWQELLLHLDRVGLAKRVLFQGVKPISTLVGQRLHRIGDPKIPPVKRFGRSRRQRSSK